MRIIHDVETPMQTSGVLKPYLNKLGHQGYNGARCDLFPQRVAKRLLGIPARTMGLPIEAGK